MMARAADASSMLTVAISRAIRERRLSLGVSQEELGNRADLHRTYISDIEAGRRNLSLRSLFRLALGLGLSVSDLLKMAELKTDPVVAPELAMPSSMPASIPAGS
jgi:transcriptional regulator with XRE-family HTH domain